MNLNGTFPDTIILVLTYFEKLLELLLNPKI